MLYTALGCTASPKRSNQKDPLHGSGSGHTWVTETIDEGYGFFLNTFSQTPGTFWPRVLLVNSSIIWVM